MYILRDFHDFPEENNFHYSSIFILELKAFKIKEISKFDKYPG